MSDDPHGIKRRREALGWTKVQLAKAAGVDRGAVAAWEDGRGARTDKLRKVLSVLDEAEADAGGSDEPEDVVTITVTVRGLGKAIRDALAEGNR